MLQTWNFNAGRDGFGYADDTFNFTSEPSYASGARAAGGGSDGSGALRVSLGGIDNADIDGMSGGWRKTFTLDGTEDVTLTFRVKLTQSNAYESDEFSQVMVALDDELVGVGGQDYVLRIAGDGAGGPNRSTGWKLVTIDLGELGPGQHTLTLGGFNNAKTEVTESTTLLFDDVKLEGTPSDDTGGGDTGLAAFEAKVLELTNAFRVANGRSPLANDAKLNAAAEDWSQSMANGDFFRHSTPDQVEEQGYDWRAWGENIAAGYATPEAVVNGWINSPGHRANMLSSNFEEIGIGYHYLANDAGSVNYHHYWTQVFGTEADALV
jgi:uncharacterized protein YkwD